MVLRRILIVGVVAAAAAFASVEAFGRKWVDATGRFSVEAELVKMIGGEVTLRRPDGRELTVPLEKLSPADQQYVRHYRRKPQATERATESPAALGQDPDESDDPGEKPARRARLRVCDAGDIEKALATPTSCGFQETPLDEVIAQLSKQHGIPMLISTRDLNDVGLAADTPITFQSKGKKLAEVLDGMLAPLQLEWMIEDGVLLIATEDGVGQAVVPHVYRLRPGVPNVGTLVQQIETTVAPASWANKGGPASIVACGPRLLVVAQSYSNHRDIAQRFGGMLAPVQPDPAAGARGGRARGAAGALEQPVEFAFDRKPLAEICAQLAERYRLKIEIDEQSLNDVGLSPDVPLTFTLRNTSLRNALTHLLRACSLIWIADEGRVLITTADAGRGQLEPAAYDVRGLMPAVQGNPAGLVQAIKCCVAPATWNEVGGPGSLRVAPPATLQVQQSPRVQRQIARLLAELSAAVR